MTRSTSWPLEPAWLVGPVERAAHTNQRGAHSGLGVGQYQGSTQAPQCGAHMYTTFHTSTRAHRGLPPGPRSAGSVHGPCSITLPISVNQNVAKKLLLATHMVDLADFSTWHNPCGTFLQFCPFGPWRPQRGLLWVHVSTHESGVSDAAHISSLCNSKQTAWFMVWSLPFSLTTDFTQEAGFESPWRKL